MNYNLYAWAIGSVSVVSLLSLCGVIMIPLTKKTLHTVIFLLTSFACGALLGNALLNQLDELMEMYAKGEGGGMRTPVIIFLSILTYLAMSLYINHRNKRSQGGHCHEDHDEIGVEGAGDGHIHTIGWMTLISHLLDNITDGIAIGSSFLFSLSAGIQTASSVIAHEIGHEFGCFALLVKAGFSRWQAIGINFLSGVAAILGCWLVISVGTKIAALSQWTTPACFGIFLCIAMCGLIPEMTKEANPKRSLVRVCLIVLGFATVAAVHYGMPG